MQGLAARQAALGLITAVIEEGRMLTENDGALSGLVPADRARALRLAVTTLRHMGRADAALARHLRKSPPDGVRHVLRLAATEILHDGAAPHGAVNAAVALLRGDKRTAHAAGLANAILRKLAETGAADWHKAGPLRLPPWLSGRVRKAYGRPAVRAIEAAHEAAPPLDLTPRNPAAAAQLAVDLGARLLPTGSLRLDGPVTVTALPGYTNGDWWVQDAAAAVPARVLGALRGARVLDLCAAPGGKTLQLAAAGAEVTAVDISAPRLGRLRENLARCGLTARVVTADALDWTPDAPFDAILCDAPCSATGTIRRHPDLPHIHAEADVPRLAALQARLGALALGWLRPGGRLVFATCSLLPEEGEAIAAHFTEGQGIAETLPVDAATLGLPGAAATPEGWLRLRPDFWADEGGMDGFFIGAFTAN